MGLSGRAPYPPHPANCAGDFYVEHGCCITCGVPLEEAPEVFGWVGDSKEPHCVVVRQPQTQDSIDRTLSAMWAAELACIRYRGNDADIGTRLVEMGRAECCDLAPPTDAARLTRSHANFRSVEGFTILTAMELAHDFVGHFKKSGSARLRERKAKALTDLGKRASVKIAWFEDVFHSFKFEKLPDGSWLVITRPRGASVGIGLSRVVDGWIRSSGKFTEIRWFSAAQWKVGGPFRSSVV